MYTFKKKKKKTFAYNTVIINHTIPRLGRSWGGLRFNI